MGNEVDNAISQKVHGYIKRNSMPEAQLKERLLEMSKESSASFAAVTKGVIHWEFLGDWDKADFLGDVLVSLVKIERARPDLRWGQTVGSTLAATFQSDRKVSTDNKNERQMRRDRAEIAQLVFQRLIEETDAPIHFVGPLLAAMQDPHESDIAKELLDRMDGKSLGAADAETMKAIASVGTASMNDEKRRDYVKKQLGRIIDEGQCDLVYFVGPLLAAMQSPEYGGIARDLLERMDGKRLGAADAETMKKIASIGTTSMNDEKRQDYAKKLLGRIIDEGECDLVYFVGPLLAAMKNRNGRDVAKELLERMDGKRLGAADAETMKKIASVGTTTMVHGGQQAHVEKLLGRIIDEGECDLVYFVGPLLAAVKDPKCDLIVRGLLERMDGKMLGVADAETMKKIATVGFSAMRNANERAHVKKMFKKIIDEGRCDLVYLVTPLLGAMRDPEQIEMARELIDRMDGKMLGVADAETMEKIASIGVVAMKYPSEKQYVEKLLGAIIDEGRCDLVYFVGPMLADMKYPIKTKMIEALLDKMDGKNLGVAGAETMKKIASVGTSAIKDKRRQKHAKNLLGSIIEEGRCDLVYFVGPMLAATQSPECRDVARDLLDSMDGKRLGKGDKDTIDMITRIFRAARHGIVQSQYVEEFTERLKKEGTILRFNEPYGGPQWKPRNNGGHHSSNSQQKNKKDNLT